MACLIQYIFKQTFQSIKLRSAYIPFMSLGVGKIITAETFLQLEHTTEIFF